MAKKTVEPITVQAKVQQLLLENPTSLVDTRSFLKEKRLSGPEVDSALAEVDWSEQARRRIELEAEDRLLGKQDFADILRGRGFEKPQQEAGMAAIDWVARAAHEIQQGFEGRKEGPAGLRALLEEDGYEPDEIDAAFKRVDYDWKGQLRSEIKEMLEAGYGRADIREQLVNEYGYAWQDVRAMLRGLNINWNEQTKKAYKQAATLSGDAEVIRIFLQEAGFAPHQITRAERGFKLNIKQRLKAAIEQYLEMNAKSEKDLKRMLTDAGFPPSEVIRAIRQAKVNETDWEAAAVTPIEQWLYDENPMLSRKEAGQQLREEGYSDAQILHAFSAIDVDWALRAQLRGLQIERDKRVYAESVMRKELAAAGFEQSEIETAIVGLLQGRSEKEYALLRAYTLGGSIGKDRIREFLKQEQFSDGTVSYVMHHLHFDWIENACEAIDNFLDHFRKDRLNAGPALMRDYLNMMKFSTKQIQEAERIKAIPWAENAAEYLCSHLTSGAGWSWFKRQLQALGYSPTQITEARKLSDFDSVDWKKQTCIAVELAFRNWGLPPDRVRTVMEQRGVAKKYLDYAFSAVDVPEDVDWDVRALEIMTAELGRELRGPGELEASMRDKMFTEEQIAYVMKFIDWPEVLSAAIARYIAADVPVDDALDELKSMGFDLEDVGAALTILAEPLL